MALTRITSYNLNKNNHLEKPNEAINKHLLIVSVNSMRTAKTKEPKLLKVLILNNITKVRVIVNNKRKSLNISDKKCMVK